MSTTTQIGANQGPVEGRAGIEVAVPAISSTRIIDSDNFLAATDASLLHLNKTISGGRDGCNLRRVEVFGMRQVTEGTVSKFLLTLPHKVGYFVGQSTKEES